MGIIVVLVYPDSEAYRDALLYAKTFWYFSFPGDGYCTVYRHYKYWMEPTHMITFYSFALSFKHRE
jgi:hypothetical protein